jgi:hypothetical protein
MLGHPDDSLTLSHWRTGYIATYALFEALGSFGLILRFTGAVPDSADPS